MSASTWLYMTDGSIIVDEPGQPFRKIEPGAKLTLEGHIWDPPIRDLSVSEVVRYDLFGLHRNGG